MSFGEEGSGGAGANVRYSRVDNETLEYLKEIISGAKGVEDPEERTAMLSSALDEIAGRLPPVLFDAHHDHPPSLMIILRVVCARSNPDEAKPERRILALLLGCPRH